MLEWRTPGSTVAAAVGVLVVEQLGGHVRVKAVSERLGHASATITLTVHQHVHPGMGREAADRFAALLEG